MEYSFKKEKKYGFGIDKMMIAIVLLIMLVIFGVFGVYLMSGKNND